MIVKIENPEGLFSRGGMDVRFTKKGKTWSSIGYVKSHLRQLKHFIHEYMDERNKKDLNDKIDTLRRKKKHLQETIIKYQKEIEQMDKDIKELE
jgi:predicted  nucleic acid-binding Zn-ribbon protein